jgi:hypothetical protein
MRNLLALFAACALMFFGLGWYLDWYKVKTDSGPSGHRSVNIDLNSPKIVEDVHKGVQRGEEKLQSVLDKKGRNNTDDWSKP